MIEIETPHGSAVAHLRLTPNPRGALVLGHGAGGSVTAPDLQAVAEAAHLAGFVVALVEQPYRVAGRRAPPRAAALDSAWIAVIEHLRAEELGDLHPLVVGGRSSGARVACRTAAATDADGVLCLAFPLRPARREGLVPAPSRLPELDGVRVPVLVVQGERDPFGMPPPTSHRTVVPVKGDHSLRADLDAVGAAARSWLLEIEGEGRASADRGSGNGATERTSPT